MHTASIRAPSIASMSPAQVTWHRGLPRPTHSARRCRPSSTHSRGFVRSERPTEPRHATPSPPNQPNHTDPRCPQPSTDDVRLIAASYDQHHPPPQSKKATPKGSLLLPLNGSSTWARTRDTRINSPLLYRLSYRGIGYTYEGVIILAKRLLVNRSANNL